VNRRSVEHDARAAIDVIGVSFDEAVLDVDPRGSGGRRRRELHGVLEPVQASPTIIEDDCFIGARSEIVEGVIVEEGAVIAMGVYIGQSTRIYDRARDMVSYGRVPAGSVVVPGALPSADGRYALAAAVIVKQVDARTRARVGINELLRDPG